MYFEYDGHVWERISVVSTDEGTIMTARRIDDTNDDEIGVRDDQREDLECMLGRAVNKAELSAFVIDGTLLKA